MGCGQVTVDAPGGNGLLLSRYVRGARIARSEFKWVGDSAIVMLGSPGTLAFLRSLGFASFGSVVDERYDSILGGHARLEAAVAEMERLVKLPPEAWANEALIAALIHNQRWFFCPGGFHDSLATRAVQAVLLAEGMVHRGGGTD